VALAVVAAVDLIYLSFSPELGALLPAAVPLGAVGLALFGGLNGGVLLHPTFGARAGAALAATLRRVDPLLRRVGLRAALGALVALAFALRLLVVHNEPIDPARADMLTLMTRAMERLLAGDNPYIVHALPYPMPLTYLPALWVPMTPAHWLGIDVRLVQIVAACAAGAVLGGVSWGGGARLGASPAIGLALVAGFLLCPATVAFVAIGHTALYWLYLTILLAALAGGSWFVAGLAAGLAAMARQTVWPALLVVALYVWRASGSTERRRFALGALLPIAGAGIVMAADPVFALWDNLRWYAALDPWEDPGRRWWILNNPGFGSVLYPLGRGDLVAPIGIAVLALALGHAWWRVVDAASAARSVALVLLAVTLAVPAPFRYEFIPVVLVVIAAALMMPRPDARRPPSAVRAGLAAPGASRRG
jgi:hypothetical protein